MLRLQQRIDAPVAVPALLGVWSVTLAVVAFTPNVSGGDLRVRPVMLERRRWRYARDGVMQRYGRGSLLGTAQVPLAGVTRVMRADSL